MKIINPDLDETNEINFQSIITRVTRESDALSYWESVLGISSQISKSIANAIKISPEDNDASLCNLSNTRMILHNFTIDLQDLKASAFNIADSLEKSTQDPIKELIKSYNKKVEELKEKSKVIIESINNLRNEVKEHKKKHLKVQEELDNLLKSEDSSLEKIKAMRECVNKSKKEYTNHLAAANKEIRENHKEYNGMINKVYDIERTKIESLKYLLTQNAACLQLLGKLFIDKAEALNSHLTTIDTKGEIEMINEECLTLSSDFAFVELPSKPKASNLKDNSELFERIFKDLKQGMEVSLDEKVNFVEFLSSFENRKLFAEKLRKISSHFNVESLSAFKTLGYLINYMLTKCVWENNDNCFIISSVLHAGGNIFFKVDWLLIIG